jgi:hypothetical protein
MEILFHAQVLEGRVEEAQALLRARSTELEARRAELTGVKSDLEQALTRLRKR